MTDELVKMVYHKQHLSLLYKRKDGTFLMLFTYAENSEITDETVDVTGGWGNSKLAVINVGRKLEMKLAKDWHVCEVQSEKHFDILDKAITVMERQDDADK